MFVDAEGTGEMGRSVVIFHGAGFSTVYSHLASLSENLRLGTEVTAGQPLGRIGASAGEAVQLEARIAKRYVERGFEPTAAEVLAPDANFVLDPFGVLVELDSRRQADGKPAKEVPPAFTPLLADADLFTLTGDPLPTDILFVVAGGAPAIENEPILVEELDTDLAFVDVLGEELEDLS